jgi:division/cell wall cluster transcriptional repressor MraZ
MVTRKTQIGWMALGGLVCLFGVVLACKLRDGNKAVAQTGKEAKKEVAEASSPPPLAPSDPVPPPPPLVAPASEKKADNPIEPKKDDGKELTPLPEAKPLPPLSVNLDPPPPAPAPPAIGSPLPPLEADKVPMPSPMAVPPDLPRATAPPSATVPPPGPAPDWSNPAVARPADPPPLPPPSPAREVPITPAQRDIIPVSATDAGNAEPKPAPPAPTINTPPPPPPVTRTESLPAPGEPPLAPAPGPVQTYSVRANGETFREIARRTLGSSERWTEIHKLNPDLKPEMPLSAGTTVKLPGDACILSEEETVQPLPSLRPKAPPTRAKVVLPLTGTYPCNLDDKKTLTLPKAMREQFGNVDTVLVSPGPDQCLWLTNQAHLDRLAERLEHSPAREIDVRVFRRLYFAQTEKTPLSADGRVTISERMAQFAGLHQEVVLVGIDDHFELWDINRWRQYTREKSPGLKAPAMAEQE